MGFLGELMGRLTQAEDGAPEGWQDRIAAVWREFTNREEMAAMPEEDRNNVLQQVSPPPPLEAASIMGS